MMKAGQTGSEASFLLAPGAGAPTTHPRMRDIARLLSTMGHVVPFDYFYMSNGPKRPDPLPTLLQAHREALLGLAQRRRGPILLAGKSMGGRIGCHLALQEQVAGLICFGYPLCGMGDRAKLRDQVLLDLRTPILFVQGTRDKLCPLDLLEEVRGRMIAQSLLHVVEGGDHSLLVTKTDLKRRRQTQEDIDAGIAGAVGEFLQFVEREASTAAK